MSDTPTPSPAPKVLRNVGEKTRTIVLPMVHPDTDEIARQSAAARGEKSNVDVLLVNPPTPDGAIWIRTQHRVGRRSRENMIWPQVSLAQLAALLQPTYSVRVIDADRRADGLEDVRGDRSEGARRATTSPRSPRRPCRTTCTARSSPSCVGAVTMAFGTHITPMPRETLRPYPALDFVLRGEPDLTLRELIDHLEGNQFARPESTRPCSRSTTRPTRRRSSASARRTPAS